MINIHHHTMIDIIGMEIIQIHMIFMVQHSSHTLLQQNDFTQQVYLKYKQQYLDEKHFRQHVFEGFQQETLCDHEAVNYMTVPAPKAIATAVAKNSDTSNSLKPNGEHFPTCNNRGQARQSNR
ncbi:unnamed protein product [Rotaria sordida]|uniref:Uncharacterized protein n=1 Tax=Rotaria sordida TaxID=392033 RepID=A0A814ZUD8_9BILA|nr:unnamed protein product [Rotaria sordida]CAF1514451.1 unnamed protein product [Rotaria sordida]